MAVSNGVMAVAAVVIVAAVGVEAYVRLQEARDLRQAIEAVSTKIDKADAAATLASTTAAQAVTKAAEAGTTAAQANQTADQALALATTAKATADRAASAAVVSAALATVSPAPAQQTALPATASDIGAGRDLALRICAACHVVSPDQHFAPTLRPPALDFRSIANRPGTTDTSLRDFMLTPHGKMPDPMLVDYQVTALVEYMMSLRDRR